MRFCQFNENADRTYVMELRYRNASECDCLKTNEHGVDVKLVRLCCRLPNVYTLQRFIYNLFS